ncbi:MAG: UbiX family flavin prenyltransferase [Chitinophagia bacterium]|jgi:4-hydroxy-3-polyprenylbenzoate decarboxylase
MGKKIAVAITGASGAIYAKRLLDKLEKIQSQTEEIAVVMSDNARYIWQSELNNSDYTKYPFRFFEKNDFTAPFASGSAQYTSLIVAPCSMGTLGRIASGISDDLITRAADVMLKERRQLILVPRETPYHLIHIRNMETITLAGGIICPATPSFYSQPPSLEALVDTVVDRILDLAHLSVSTYRWGS